LHLRSANIHFEQQLVTIKNISRAFSKRLKYCQFKNSVN